MSKKQLYNLVMLQKYRFNQLLFVITYTIEKESFLAFKGILGCLAHYHSCLGVNSYAHFTVKGGQGKCCALFVTVGNKNQVIMNDEIGPTYFNLSSLLKSGITFDSDHELIWAQMHLKAN